MENEATYDRLVSDSVKIRREIDEKHWAEMNALSKQFQTDTGLSHKEFQLAKNALYYQGGWPSVGTKPRLETAVQNFSQLCQVLQYLGRTDQLNECLTKYGMQVTVTPIATTPTQRVQDTMDSALALQKVICGLADEIKLDKGSQVEANCGVLVPHFITNVKILAKSGRGGKIDKDLDNFKSNTESINEVALKLSTM